MRCIYNVSSKWSRNCKGFTGVGKKVSKSPTKKNSQLVLRLDKGERDAFVEKCKQLDTSAAREIRRFIRAFMKENTGE